jgi:hypothetical protein
MMDYFQSFFTYNWQRKLVALITALVIWFFVNQSITDTKTIPNVPIRIINLPDDKTIPGMQPNGIIGKRIPLKLQGTKNVVDMLEPGDLEVLLDVSAVQQNDWVVQISKKNLVSLNPAIDLSRHISDVTHPEFVLKFSQLMNAKIPVAVNLPNGEPPPGYEFLDIWPRQLTHTVVGPQEQVQELMAKGLELDIDMNMISKADLDKIKVTRENFHDDEVSFYIPMHWKKVVLPFKGGMLEEISDADGQKLHIDFLRREYLPLNQDISVRAFYPLATLDTINPKTMPLLAQGKLKEKNGVFFLSTPLYISDSSIQFLDVIKDNLEIVVLVENIKDTTAFNWSLEVIDPQLLEDKYVNTLISYNNSNAISKGSEFRHNKKREKHLRERFRLFAQRLTLYTAPEKKLQLDVRLTKEGISAIPTVL